MSARARGPPVRAEQAAGARHSGRRRGRAPAVRPRAPRARLAPRLAAGRHAARPTAGAVREARTTPEQRPRAPSTAGLLSAQHLHIHLLEARMRCVANRAALLGAPPPRSFVVCIALHLELVSTAI